MIKCMWLKNKNKKISEEKVKRMKENIVRNKYIIKSVETNKQTNM